MSRLVTYKLRDGGTVMVEESDGPSVPVTRGLHPRQTLADTAEGATAAFEDSLAPVRPVAQSIIDRVRSMADAPDGVEVEFGLALHGEIGVACITKAGADANFRVKLSWGQRLAGKALPTDGVVTPGSSQPVK